MTTIAMMTATPTTIDGVRGEVSRGQVLLYRPPYEVLEPGPS
jgi:hypothetical protein